VFIVVYFVIDSVRKLLDTPSYNPRDELHIKIITNSEELRILKEAKGKSKVVPVLN
jgi:hypothetical protein